MNAERVIYRQEYAHKGHAFSVLSYLDDPDPKRSTMRFAFRVEGVTVEGLPDRAEAIRQARRRIDELSAKPVEATPAADPPQASQDQNPQQPEVAQRQAEAKSRPAQLSLFSPSPADGDISTLVTRAGNP
jgi:hypothetical protein